MRARCWFWFGWFRTKLRDFSGAFQCFERVLSSGPDNVRTLCWAGYCLIAAQRYQDAMRYYDRALQNDPKCAYAHAQLGRAFLYLGKPHETLDSLSRAFRILPRLKRQYHYRIALAIALARLGRIDEALEAYNEAARSNPRSSEALAGVGWALYEKGQFSEAEPPLRKAIKLDPHYAKAYETLGLTLAMADKPRDALAALRRAVDLDATSPVWFWIGLIHSQLKEYKEAIEAEEKELERGPNADAYCVLAASCGALGDHERAIQSGTMAIELRPDYEEAWHNLGQAYLESGQFDKSVAALEKVLQIGNGISDTHLLLGLAYLGSRNRAAALKQCKILQGTDAAKALKLAQAMEASTA